MVEKLQHKTRTYKKQIEDAEEIAALNLAKFRKAQQQLEEVDIVSNYFPVRCPDVHIVQAEDRSNTAETNIGRIRAGSQVPSVAGCLCLSQYGPFSAEIQWIQQWLQWILNRSVLFLSIIDVDVLTMF